MPPPQSTSKRVQQAPQQPPPPQHEQPEARKVSQVREDSVPVLFEEMDGWFQKLKRDLSAFNALNLAFLTASGQLPPGERARGMPIFEFKAPGPDGREPITCVLDLKKINPQYVQHVLIPLVNTVAADMLESVAEVGSRVQMLMPKLQAMVAPQQGGAEEGEG